MDYTYYRSKLTPFLNKEVIFKNPSDNNPPFKVILHKLKLNHAILWYKRRLYTVTYDTIVIDDKLMEVLYFPESVK